jgi:hypothetical protein
LVGPILEYLAFLVGHPILDFLLVDPILQKSLEPN